MPCPYTARDRDPHTMIKRVLVANRGEIALRIIRACHEEGLEAVAVYSEADRLAPHVRAADAAVSIGPAPASESYLNIPRLVAAARDTGCQAVHPGYGFLSERAAFAEACIEAGLVFVGPPPSAIRAMGDKTEARRRMKAAGVPIVPGTTAPLHDAADARREAQRIGYPVLLKASAGGGGKGMRLVRGEPDIQSAFEGARSEAQKAFGDGAVYVEKYLDRPRHVEIQVLGDHRGRVVALGERECSIQRRHQKLIEEAPSPVVSPALRRRLSEAATLAAGAVGYVGAGTIEFLLGPGGEFHFLEMNTRIQVEHPVTELVYGVDLVREQLRIAAGEAMRVRGNMEPRGHALECRITAEDPFNDFLPAAGVLQYLRFPAGPGVRWDGGVEAGNAVTLFYDPLLAKLVTWGENREIAIQRMRRALRELVIVGLPTSQAFHLRVMEDPDFLKGEVDITYLERAGARLLAAPPLAGLERALAVTAALLADAHRTTASTSPSDGRTVRPSGWVAEGRREGLRE
jgi:acetyl-CoA carboxylase, biotin carboxylase subunit